jgi:hypothetical protein
MMARITRLPGHRRRAWRTAPLGARLTFAWLLLVIVTSLATMAWAATRDPETVESWRTYLPVAVVLWAPVVPCTVLGVRAVGWRRFSREVWLIFTHRHEVFSGSKR